MKTALYCRVSSREQEETGYSLPAQEKLLNTYAQKYSFDITKTFAISESASGRKQREIFKEMMAFVEKQNVKIIICEKVDRLTRNFKDAVMIDEWLEKDEERQVHLVKDSLILHKNSRSQEKLNWGIRILFAKNYIDNLSEEVVKGYKEKISQGWYPHPPPMGYKTVGERGHKIHVIDEHKAPFIKKLFELYGTGNYSLKLLTDTMQGDGLRSISGKKVVKSQVHKMLSDIFYTGRFMWMGQVYQAKHEPLITLDHYNRVQQLLKSKTTPKYSKHSFLFKGLIRCAECEGVITWEVQKGIAYGHCNHYRNCKQVTWVKEYELDEQLTSGFDALKLLSPRLVEWIRKVLKESHQDQISYRTTQLTELQARQDQLRQRLDRLYDDKVDGIISEDFFEKKHQLYAQELEDITSKINSHDLANLKNFEMGLNIFDLAQRAKELYQKASVDQKSALLRLMYEEMRLDEGELTYHYTKPFELLVKAVKKTNSSKLAKVLQKDDKIFELSKKDDSTLQNASLEAYRPIVLPRLDSNQQPADYTCPRFTPRSGLSHHHIY